MWKWKLSFKPCYKWNTFNTWTGFDLILFISFSFKPCYKWNTFNTIFEYLNCGIFILNVLNLVISGIPSIRLLEEPSEDVIKF